MVRIRPLLEKIASSAPGEARTKLDLLAENIVTAALHGDCASRTLLVERLYPALNRHEIAGAEGDAIQLRLEAEIEHAAEELQAMIAGR